MIAASTDLYPLSPMQQGMLYHALSEPHSGVDIEQLVITLPAGTDSALLRAAWDRVVARHAILRTAFRWDGAEPLQSAAENVEVPFAEESFPGDTPFAEWLHADRTRGFAMDEAPFMRLRLFRECDGTSRLVWTFHHALLDGRSFPIVLDEVFAFYEAPALADPPTPTPFRHFVEWQRAQDFTTSEHFWRTMLAGFTAPTPLTVCKLPGCAAERAQGDAQFTLSRKTTTALSDFANSISVTLNTLVHAAWALVLSRYSGEEDICFGATRACRKSSIEGAETIVGLLINTVPVRTKVVPEAPLVDWLQGIRETWIAIRPHEHTPLARVQAWSELPPGRALFDSLIVFENYDLTSHFDSRGGAWTGRTFRLIEQTSFPLCIAAYAGEALHLVAEFDRSHFDDATIARLLGHVATALEEFTAGHKTVGAIPILTPAEYAALVTPPSHPQQPLANSKPLHALFSQQVAKAPGAVALVQGDIRLTYADLDRRADCIAAHLAGLGAREETIVGLCMERTPDLVAAILGILKANAAYLPIDLAYPADRLAFMLEDARAPILLTQRSLADRLPGSPGARVVFIEDIDFSTRAAAPTHAAPDALCYVIYTSGSTGKPKGCCVTHHNVARLFTATQNWFSFDERDVWTLFHSTAFDFSVWEIWGALLHGGTLVVVPFEVSRSPGQFHELVIRERVTVLNQTPSAFRQFLAADSASQNNVPLSLRTVIFGGEALEMQSLQPWFERHGDKHPQLVNMYGITETTVHVTYRPLTSADTQGGSVIGGAIPDLAISILDPQQRPVPIGVPGELHVGGAGLARGYLHRPELTAERFVENPFASGERLYRTGDLARWLPNRDIEYLGRIDQQVKIRGFRIELGEIETVLAKHPRIAEAAVLARNDAADGNRLVAWFVANAGGPPDTASLRAHLKQFLPDYMIPAAFVQVARMPLTNNGKLDTAALPAPGSERPSLPASLVGPRNESEDRIAAVWQRVLKLDRVGIHDNFFELGGDSILSILVVAQCRQAGIALTPKQIFNHPTIAELAALTTPAAGAMVELERTGEVPLTPVQRWFFAHDFADSHHWNQSFVFHLAPNISDKLLDAAFVKVVAAHPAFALRFALRASGWSQYFSSAENDRPKPPLRCSEAESPDSTALQSSLTLNGPLIRYSRHGDLVTIAVHHLVMDGVSWRILLADLDAALCGKLLAQPTSGFHTWAHAIARAAESALLADEFSHWKRLLAVTRTPLPLDFPGGESVESSAETHTFTLDEAGTAALLRDLRALNVRIHDALLAALAQSLTSWTGQEQHIIEIEGHGREEAALAELAGSTADLSHTIGWFTTIFPVALHAGSDPTETLSLTTASLASVPRSGFGFPLLQHSLPKVDADVLFNYLGHFDHVTAGLESISLANTPTAPWHAAAAQRTHVIEINALVIHDRLEVRWTFSRNLHRHETVERLATDFAASLAKLATATAPTPFPLAKCDVAGVLIRHHAATDIYPLSPMQRLFLALETARPGSGTDQWHATLSGPLDVPRLHAAWRAALLRHPALRTAYDLTDTPHAVTIPDIEPHWHAEDWRGVPYDEQERRFHSFLAADEAQPFDLSAPPLTRLALFRTAENEHRFVWTHHHLEIDGWSWPVLFRDIASLYDGEALPGARAYRDYIGWLGSRQTAADEAFWRGNLAGFSVPTPLPFPRDVPPSGSRIEVAVGTPSIGDLARELRVTPNAVVQTAWASVLSHRSGAHDIVFGAAFSGRPDELDGSAGMVGYFVNNLPIRVRSEPGDSFLSLAQRVHRHLADASAHQHTPLTDVQKWSDLPWNARMFDSLLVFQNYVIADSAMRLGTARIECLHAPVRTNYPLTLIATPGDDLRLTLVAQPGVTDRDGATALLGELLLVLSAVSADPGRPVAEITSALRPPATRSTLPDPGPAISAQDAPSNDSERAVAEVWRAAFGRDTGVNDNFFDIGGHSLLMLQVHARLTLKVGREIPVVKLFQHPTIRSIARFLAGGSVPSPAVSDARDRASRAKAALARRANKPRTA